MAVLRGAQRRLGDVHNDGTSSGDFGLLSSGTSGEGSLDSPLPSYYGYELANKLAVKGATVGTLNLGQANSFGYSSALPNGSHAVMLVNANPSSSFSVSPSSVGLASTSGTQYTYDSAHPAIATGSFSGSSISVPPESVVVLTGSGSSGTGGGSGGGSGGGGGSSAGSGAFVSGYNSSKCLDDNNDSFAAGSKAQIWDCNSGPAQDWTVNSDGTITINGNCLDIYQGGTANGSQVQTWTCNGQSNQQWKAENGTLVNPASGKCLDDPGWNTDDGTQLDIWTCNGGANQKWTQP